MSAITHNLNIHKGDSYKLRANLTIQVPDFCVGSACSTVPLDLTDKDVIAVIKSSFDACNTVAEFEVKIDDPLTGIVDLFLPSSESSKLNESRGYVWDLRVVDEDNDEAFTAFTGTVKVLPTTV